jgi:hypothetical protein
MLVTLTVMSYEEHSSEFGPGPSKVWYNNVSEVCVNNDYCGGQGSDEKI